MARSRYSYASRQDRVVVPVSRRTRFAVEAHKVCDTDEAGLDSYSRTSRRCSISVPWVESRPGARWPGFTGSVPRAAHTAAAALAPWAGTTLTAALGGYPHLFLALAATALIAAALASRSTP
jgi:hypothetical protein